MLAQFSDLFVSSLHWWIDKTTTYRKCCCFSSIIDPHVQHVLQHLMLPQLSGCAQLVILCVWSGFAVLIGVWQCRLVEGNVWELRSASTQGLEAGEGKLAFPGRLTFDRKSQWKYKNPHASHDLVNCIMSHSMCACLIIRIAEKICDIIGASTDFSCTKSALFHLVCTQGGAQVLSFCLALFNSSPSVYSVHLKNFARYNLSLLPLLILFPIYSCASVARSVLAFLAVSHYHLSLCFIFYIHYHKSLKHLT